MPFSKKRMEPKLAGKPGGMQSAGPEPSFDDKHRPGGPGEDTIAAGKVSALGADPRWRFAEQESTLSDDLLRQIGVVDWVDMVQAAG